MGLELEQKGLWLKCLLVIIFLSVLLFFFVRSKLAPAQQNDVCALFKANPSWYSAAKHAERKWSIPVSVQMAVMHQESHFRANAHPTSGLMSLFTGGSSTAKGYAQALDNTWKSYLRHNHLTQADRSSFVSSTDFIGWYLHSLSHDLHLKKNDAYHLYLAYHEGESGYRKQRYQQKKWLQNVAHNVAEQANLYHQQLIRCHQNLQTRAWW
jgi:hypothetical protein